MRSPPCDGAVSEHGPGRVLADLAVMLADGGEAISDLAMRRLTYPTRSTTRAQRPY
jgi:hypothetical protein